jgi:AGZA family xanthine/uracil permease-like MFS transporter
MLEHQHQTNATKVSAGPLSRIDRFFEVSAKGSTFRREIAAGFATFLALSYIFVVNPAILANAGIDKSVSLFATITVSALATLAMGLWARLPFVVSTGMEMNAYVAFFAVGALGFGWQQALGMVFWASVIMIVLTLLRVREEIIDSIPDPLKIGLSFSVGVFLVLIALSIGGIIKYEGLTLKEFGSLTSPNAYALYLGVALVFILQRLKVPGAILMSILVTAGAYHLLGYAGPPDGSMVFSQQMFSGIGALDFSVILDPKAISVIVVLFVLDFFGSVAKFIGLTARTNILVNGKLPRRDRALLVDGVGSLGASVVGTTSVVAFVESAVGIGSGARTGLAAVTTGVLMLCCFVAFPVIQAIPVAATTGALVYVGVRLCPTWAQFAEIPLAERLALAVMPLVTVATFAIDKAMLAGFLLYLVARGLGGHRLNPYLIGSTAVLALGVLLQFVY